MNNTVLGTDKKDIHIKRGQAEVYFEHLGHETKSRKPRPRFNGNSQCTLRCV